MSHKGIRLLIKDTAESLGDNIQFTYARTSDFNLGSDKQFPFITLDLLTAIPEYTVNNVSNYQKRWLCSMAFYQKDREGSKQEEYEKILDEMDDYVDKFINKLNTYAFSQQIDSDDIIITSVNQQAFIKATAHILSGFLLTFQMQVTDQFNYCHDC